MKGVVLCGGLGTRMGRFTKVTNKHLAPVYDKIMIDFPLGYLSQAGVKEVMVVTGDLSGGEIMRYVGTGKEWNLNVSYRHQEGNGGIADALGLAESFAGRDPIAVLLGDGIFSAGLPEIIRARERFSYRACVVLSKVKDPSRFGVPVFKRGAIDWIVEKPKNPPTNYAVTGAYFYPPDVFSLIENLSPSKRGELEVSDLNNLYARQGRLDHVVFRGIWQDAGTQESLLEAAKLRAKGAI